MFDIKNVFVQVFRVIQSDAELLSLIGIDRSDYDTENDFLVALRKQVIDAEIPDDLLNNYDIRLCIHEAEGGYTNQLQEVGYLSIDIHISQDKNTKDRRHLQIQKRIIEMLDTNNRKRCGLPIIPIGLDGLNYKRRLTDRMANTTGWEKHSVIFEYKYLII